MCLQCVAARGILLLPAPSPHERSESTKTEHRRRLRRGAERVSRLLDEGFAAVSGDLVHCANALAVLPDETLQPLHVAMAVVAAIQEQS